MSHKCKRTFETHRGLQQHRRSCKEYLVTESNLTILSSKSISLTTDTCDNIWNENKRFIEGKINSAYNEIVCWKKKCFSYYQLEQQGKDSLKKWKTCKFSELQIRSWNNSIKGIDDYAWFITSKSFLEFKIKRKLWNIEAKIIALENGQLDQLMFKVKTIQDRLQNYDKLTTNKSKETLHNL